MRLLDPINVSATDEVRNILSSLNSSLDSICLMDPQRSGEWEGLSLTSLWRSRKVCDDFGFDFCIVDSSFKCCFESNIFF